MSHRPSMEHVMMRFAREIARRSTCFRHSVGVVVADPTLSQVLGIGYNGSARGLANACIRTTPGNCGCLHAEINALIKAPGLVPKIVFTTLMPCEACAIAMVNANVERVYYDKSYRSDAGLTLLERAGVGALSINALPINGIV